MAQDRFEPPEQFNMVEYFLDRNLADGRGGRTALLFDPGEGDLVARTFDEVAEDTRRFRRLVEDLGVEMEQRVLLVLGDTPAFPTAWFGTLRAGAVVCSVNPRLPADDIGSFLRYTRAKVVCTDADGAAAVGRAAEDAPALRAVVSFEEHDAPIPPRLEHVRWWQVREELDPPEGTAPTHRDDVAVWLFTSGTTGKPKGAVHFHRDFVFNAERYARDVLALGPDDRTISVPKLFFGYATGTNLMFPWAAGASVGLFREHPKPEVLVRRIERLRPTVLVGVPTSFNGLLGLPGFPERYDLSSLRFATSAGEALPPELYTRWKEATGVEILDGIGSAEMFHVFISNRRGKVRPGTLGRLVDGYRARIVGPDGRDVEPGQVGTLWIGGGSAALCYWHNREESVRTMRGDWIVTADQFRVDEDGYFHYEGRTDDMLKVGGIFVSPLEIESCLLQHPGVDECAVVGVEEEGLVKPWAFVVPGSGHRPGEELAAELVSWVKARLAPYKAPRRVRFVESLPRNDRGKVARRVLREQARDAGA